MGKEHTYLKYTDALFAFTRKYEYYKEREQFLIQCDLEKGNPEPDARRSCLFDLEWSKRCNIYRAFGYDDGCPCVVLKINPVYGWIPDLGTEQLGPEVRCYGLHSWDKELLMNSSISYYDARNMKEGLVDYGVFPHYYFPYLAQENYDDPLVFVEFCSPPRYSLINVQCEVNAKNYRKTVRFEIMMD